MSLREHARPAAALPPPAPRRRRRAALATATGFITTCALSILALVGLRLALAWLFRILTWAVGGP